jgi:hypothetical protein
MTINCTTFDEFMQTIGQLVVRGLTFRADAHKLTIELLGGY